VTRFGSDVAPIGEKLIMHKGDVLFGKRRAYQKKVAIAPFDGIFSAHGMVLRPNVDVIDPDFFPLFISSDYFLDAAIKISVGSLSPTINWRDLKVLEFELPDLETQRKLAAVLWSINDTMEAYKKLISATYELVKSQFIEMFGSPLKNDFGWATKKMKEVAPAISYDGDIAMQDGCNWLLNLDMVESNTGKIINKVMVPIGDIGTSTTKFSPQNILFSKLRPYLNKVAMPDDYGYVTTEMIPLLPSDEYLNPVFLTMLLRGNEFLGYIEKQVTGTKMPRVQMNVFWDFDVILPPLSLQEHFAAFVQQSDKSKLLASNLVRLITENVQQMDHCDV
jgi:type I restriction enzyme S subunit